MASGRRSYVGFVALVVAAGCGPGKLLPPPADMPTQLGPRRLWHTPRAYIYAAEKSVAGETDRWIAEVAGHIRRTYKADLGKGLVIVVDKAEPPVIDSYDRLLALQRGTAVAGGASEDELPSPVDQRKRLAKSGMSEALACRVTPVALDDAAVHAAGLDGRLPRDVAWRMACPSQRLMESATWEFAPKAIERTRGKVFAVATAWAWPAAFGEAAKTFRLARDTLAFQLWANARTDWSAQRRKREVARYTKERAFVISPTLALAISLAQSQADAEDASAETPAD